METSTNIHGQCQSQWRSQTQSPKPIPISLNFRAIFAIRRQCRRLTFADSPYLRVLIGSIRKSTAEYVPWILSSFCQKEAKLLIEKEAAYIVDDTECTKVLTFMEDRQNTCSLSDLKGLKRGDLHSKTHEKTELRCQEGIRESSKLSGRSIEDPNL